MDYSFSEILAKRLKELIAETNEKQAAIAHDVDMQESRLSNLINGKTKNTSAQTIVKLARYFNVSIDYLLGFSDVKTLDPNVQTSAAYTGLSEETIKNLHNNLTDNKQSIFIRYIEFILNSDFVSAVKYHPFDYDLLKCVKLIIANSLAVVDLKSDIAKYRKYSDRSQIIDGIKYHIITTLGDYLEDFFLNEVKQYLGDLNE